MLRFIKKAFKKTIPKLDDILTRSELCALDLQVAKHILIQQAQTTTRELDVEKWNLQRDKDNLLRCHGRLSGSHLPHPQKYPIFLSKHSKLTLLIIMDCRRQLLHSGLAATLVKVRQKFWIPAGRNTVKRTLAHCNLCKRWTAKPFQLPPMPDLSATRVVAKSAFFHVGIDLFGPITVNCATGTQKRWVTLFTCLLS